MIARYEIAGAPRDSVRCSRDGADGWTAWMTHRDNLKQALAACRKDMRNTGVKSAVVEIYYARVIETRNLRASRK